MKKDFWCVAALDENGYTYIIQRSPDAQLCDLLQECSGEDNGFNEWEKGQTPGLYKLQLSPWSHHDYQGDIDTGIDVTRIEPLYRLEPIARVNLICERCESEEDVQMESSDTCYPYDGVPGSEDDPNKDIPLCRPCAEEHHAYWRERWDDYYNSRGI